MNSSNRSEVGKLKIIIFARFNWIDLLAVPIAVSVMETQPITVVISACLLLLTGNLNALPVVPGVIFVLILCLRWWMRFVKRFGDEQLMRSFKAGFVILLVILFCALDPTYSALFAMLIYALPLFFLSALVAFSFNRLSSVKKEYLQRPSQADPTRSWSLLLLSLCIMLVSAMFVLEFPILQFLSIIFAPLRNPLMALLAVLVDIPVTESPPPRKKGPIRPVPKSAIAPTHVSIWAGIIGLLLIFAICIAVIIIVLRAWYTGYRDKGDELHEAVSARTVLRERRRKRQRDRAAALHPASARARYRAFLQAMARRGRDLARQPDETPLEYQTRLLAAAENAREQPARDTPPALLGDLTSAYVLERYGGRQSNYSAAHNWLAALVRHFG